MYGLGLSAGYNQQGSEAQRPRYETQSVDHRLPPISDCNLLSPDGDSPRPSPKTRWPDNESNVRFRGSAVVREYRFSPPPAANPSQRCRNTDSDLQRLGLEGRWGP